MNTKKVALGLSGGVDSSVCAKLLLDQGYQVTAVYLECYGATGCRNDTDRQDALLVATDLGIPFVSLDMKADYQAKVLDYFYAAYAAGLTPNPDVICNREIKFGLFYDWAIKQGFDFVATGHYAAIETDENELSAGKKLNFLTVPTDTRKDQTYFLCQLHEEQLSRVLFPLSKLSKTQVRALAKKWRLSTAKKKDSTGVCFVGEVDLGDFLAQKIALTPGAVCNSAGQVIGTHRGMAAYTIGQRHGFTIFNQSPATPPLYVIGKDLTANQLTVGDWAATAKQNFVLTDFHSINPDLPCWHDPAILAATPFLARLRHTGPLLPATLRPSSSKSTYALTLAEPVHGVGEGQFAVIYAATGSVVCLGGGPVANAPASS